jgi:hypothetical protein
MSLIEKSRHVPLEATPWDECIARSAIDEIVSDALAHFDPERFWPGHPLDNTKDGHSSLYLGAAGMVWGLDYLRRICATTAAMDFRPMLSRLLATTQAEMSGYEDYAENGSFLFGDLGTALVVMRLVPGQAIAELIYARAEIDSDLPVRDLMWGMPGAMLACIHMTDMTGEPRWPALFGRQAERLLAELEETKDGPLWIQDLYGKHRRWLGPVHGFAGNMIPFIRGWSWLTDEQQKRIAEVATGALVTNGCRSDHGLTWKAFADDDRPPYLCQHCHGAPGMVTTFADAPFTSPELEALLLDGGHFTWAAGPLAKGSNLCHGTGGNGYAFLKLHRRTGDAVWLERARAFAMTAIAQCRAVRAEVGRGRYTLWTGDVGLAVYLWDCLTARPHFPSVDVF